ncbi:MAG: fluoride efflux transporter CrcB [Sphingomicrobium sp.]
MTNPFVLVFLGGGLGSVFRLAVYRLARLWLPPELPWGTLAVNVIGGFGAGLVAAWLVGRSAGSDDPAALFLLTGLLGGFTTFSAFSLDAVLLWQRGAGGLAALYVVASVVLAIAGVAAGMIAARLVLS